MQLVAENVIDDSNRKRILLGFVKISVDTVFFVPSSLGMIYFDLFNQNENLAA